MLSPKKPQKHNMMWTDLLEDLGLSSATWWQIASFLYNKNHGYSNYVNCLKRGPTAIRNEVYLDEKVKQYISAGTSNSQKVDAILDEMCHLLNTQSNPSRRLKYAGLFFIKCITKVYSSIYVNNQLLPMGNGFRLVHDSFRHEFLSISNELPIVILPTHRSYMDFLFISYIMTHYELPLPIVATGDNFKAMGKILTDYLKSTGGFLLRRNAAKKKDIEANVYHDILRAYVHSLLKGGENPIEFFMEGTRTRVGQVLKPKTGLLSMVVDAMIDGVVEDVYILPVAINYQRPIEEQLFVAENTPQINRKKPRESVQNLISAFDAVMRRHYGKVYVRFLKPFKLSSYFKAWKSVTNTSSIENGARDGILFDFTNSLASKVCLAQANNNILMPFNLTTCSILSRTFFNDQAPDENDLFRIRIDELMEDFQNIEDLLQSTQDGFLPGWNSRLDVLDDFKLNRDNLIRSSKDRRFVELNSDPLTFQTMLYYSNQTIQMLIPVAICFLLSDSTDQWNRYKMIRTLLMREFFSNESFMEQEFDEALKAMNNSKISASTKSIIVRHLAYFIQCYLRFLNYLTSNEDLFDKNEFFRHINEPVGMVTKLYICKDMLKNMISLVVSQGICKIISDSLDNLKVVNKEKLGILKGQYEEVIKLIRCQLSCYR